MCSPALRLMTDRACHQGQILLGEAGLLLAVGALPPDPPRHISQCSSALPVWQRLQHNRGTVCLFQF